MGGRCPKFREVHAMKIRDQKPGFARSRYFSRPILGLACLVWSCQVLQGLSAIYYVDGYHGDDSNPGTEESPFATLKKAATGVAVDDTVRIMSDTIYEHQVYFRPNITLEPADPDGMVTIDCENAGGGIEIGGVVRRIRFERVDGDASKNVESAVVARGDLLVEGCEFYQCENNYNGAAITAYNDLTVSNCSFNSCGTWGGIGDSGLGGAIYSGFPGELVVVDSTFQDCFAAEGGGAVHVIGGSFIQRSRFVNCYADGDGGEALNVVGGGHGTDIVNCLFAENGNGDGSGGTIAIGTSSARLAYCTIVDNSGSGIWLRDNYGGMLSATHSIVWGNGEAFQEDGEGAIYITRSTIQDEPVNGYEIGCQVGVDPLLASDYKLEEGSPCVDAEDEAPGADSLFSYLNDCDDDDLDRIARPRGMRYDHGCYESAFMEDAYEPNNVLSSAYFPAAQTWLSAGKGLGVQANDDWFGIYVATGYERVQVDCRFSHAEGDIDIALYDADENLLEVSTDPADNGFIDYVVPSAGNYYIKVFFGDAGNTYDLWWNTLAANTYTVSYDANGATSGEAPASQTKIHDVALTLAGNSGNLAKAGSNFAGWNTAANGSGTDYAVGESYTLNASVKLYAKWTAGAPNKAVNPSPADGAGNQDRNVDLSWENGGGATSYNVIFNGQSHGNQQGTTFDTGPLGYGMTYQWRIDAVNDAGTTPGDSWSFTTTNEPVPPPDPSDYVCTTNANDTLTIVGYTGPGGSVSLPSNIGGRSVSIIGEEAFIGNASLTRVIIPDGIATIDDNAFYGCTGMVYVGIGNDVRNIGFCAFQRCTALTNVSIPESVYRIEGTAFGGCTSLLAIDVDVDNYDYRAINGVLYDKDMRNLIQYPSGKSGHFNIPDGVASIEEYAFQDSINLTGVVISDSVTLINYGAFMDCSNLKDAVIGSGVTMIDTFSFGGCVSLARVIIGRSVETVRNDVFGNCTSLAGVYFCGPAPAPQYAGVFYNANKVIVYYLPGKAGWANKWCGRPTALWRPASRYDESFGVQANRFGFNIFWARGQVVVVDVCTNLENNIWVPLQTNTLDGDSLYFSDSKWTNDIVRFYRIRSP